jgi:hypothetical protein
MCEPNTAGPPKLATVKGGGREHQSRCSSTLPAEGTVIPEVLA